MDWTISDGSGGESYTVGRAESESEVEIVGKPRENQNFRDEIFRDTDIKTRYYRPVPTQLSISWGCIFDTCVMFFRT